MDTEVEIEAYIASQPMQKCGDMQALHRIILQIMPACTLWFLDGKTVKIKLFRILMSDMDFK